MPSSLPSSHSKLCLNVVTKQQLSTLNTFIPEEDQITTRFIVIRTVWTYNWYRLRSLIETWWRSDNTTISTNLHVLLLFADLLKDILFAQIVTGVLFPWYQLLPQKKRPQTRPQSYKSPQTFFFCVQMRFEIVSLATPARCILLGTAARQQQPRGNYFPRTGSSRSASRSLFRHDKLLCCGVNSIH